MSEEILKTRDIGINIQGKNFNVKTPLPILDIIDELVRQGKYSSRSQAVRVGIRLLLESEGLLNTLPTLDELDAYTKDRLSKSAIDFLTVGDDK